MTTAVERTLKKYLPSLEFKTRELRIKNIPPAYQGIYAFEELNMRKQPFLLIKVKDRNLGPKDFKKHGRRLKESIDHPQVWYLKELHAHKVRRMIENELNFILEDKQIHLPVLHVSLSMASEKVRTVRKISGLGINLLIREILKGDLSGKSKVEIAGIFKSSKMTMGRAIEPLLSAGLCEENKVGVAKLIRFKPRTELWRHLQKNVHSPVKEAVFLPMAPKKLPYSGITALARQSMLAEDPIPTFAIERKEFNKKYKNAELALEDEALTKVELWDRPVTLDHDSNINVIDLYLILRDSSDDRVQTEMGKLLQKHDLKADK
ncbi:MAG: hypothetical protein KF865_01135 [Bdellovibrionaceae bacterium]|nr:hypothetical protein [Pseudobdellovibrionaceae bacterium]